MKIFFTILFFCFSIFINAQDECKNALYHADKLYQKGQMQEAINLLEPCSKKYKDKEQRFEAFRLLGLLHQFMNNEEKTKYYIKEMLLLHPDYQKYPNIDPLEFTKLVNKFEVRPLLNAGFTTGYNRTGIQLIKSNSTYISPQIYFPTTGYQFGGFAEYMFKPFLSFRFDAMMNGVFVKHQVDSAGGWKQNYEETQQYFLFNLSTDYHQKIYKNLSAYCGIGYGVNSLLNSKVYFESENIETHSVQLATKDAVAERIKSQPFASFKIGLQYPVGKGFFSIDASYLYFMKNTVDANKRMNDLNFIMNNQYINDDISLRMMMINFSYKMPLMWSIKYKK